MSEANTLIELSIPQEVLSDISAPDKLFQSHALVGSVVPNTQDCIKGLQLKFERKEAQGLVSVSISGESGSFLMMKLILLVDFVLLCRL